MVINRSTLPVIDFFSGAGGMSYGFYCHPSFNLIAAIDAELAKPSANSQSSNCNETYYLNLKIKPRKEFLNCKKILEIGAELSNNKNFNGVLLACPPCTDFTRAKPENHNIDGSRNELTSAIAKLIFKIRPKYFLYENAREAFQGNYTQHLDSILHVLEGTGYSYNVEIFNLNDFGLPQNRERVILIASRDKKARSLRDLWRGLSLHYASTVGSAFERLFILDKKSPGFLDKRYPQLTEKVFSRISAIPKNGGSWIDIKNTHEELLIPSMQKKIISGNTGSYQDVYGRMTLDKPAPTIKRECSHVGNGRYTHPTENRILTVGEMAFLQGFPINFKFESSQLSNCYRQIGDAVPPLISYQLAWLINWIETGIYPLVKNICLKNSALDSEQFKLI